MFVIGCVFLLLSASTLFALSSYGICIPSLCSIDFKTWLIPRKVPLCLLLMPPAAVLGVVSRFFDYASVDSKIISEMMFSVVFTNSFHSKLPSTVGGLSLVSTLSS